MSTDFLRPEFAGEAVDPGTVREALATDLQGGPRGQVGPGGKREGEAIRGSSCVSWLLTCSSFLLCLPTAKPRQPYMGTQDPPTSKIRDSFLKQCFWNRSSDSFLGWLLLARGVGECHQRFLSRMPNVP